ncbi:MAG: pantetheine-phosphate adenylyltransferase [Nitrospirota bacterium]
MKIGVYPGTFDPITNGHIDLIERSLRIFDKVIVAVAPNPRKSPLFDLTERLEMIKEGVNNLKNVEIGAFDSLLVDYIKRQGAIAIIRGLRAVSDFEFEFQMALMNRKLDSTIETVFLVPSEKYSYLTSSIVKEVSSYCGDIRDLVPSVVIKRIEKKNKEKRDETNR